MRLYLLQLGLVPTDFGDAVIRYQSRLEIIVGGNKAPLKRYWHTDTYEKQSGRWQVVWSQATEIQ